MADAILTIVEERVELRTEGDELLVPHVAAAIGARAGSEAAEQRSTQSAKAAALSETGAIAANGKMFATISDGVAATADGGFFTVAGDGPSTYAILYKRTGTIGVEQARYVSKAAYEGAGGADLIGYQLHAASAKRSLAAKAREQAAIQDFMIVATGADYQTAGWQNAIDWSSANNRLVEDRVGADWTTGPLLLKPFTSLKASSRRGTRFIPRVMTVAEAANPLLNRGHLNLAPGPVIETYLEGLDFAGNGLNPGWWGAYMQARKPEGIGEYPHGGWWYSSTVRCSWVGYPEGGMWLRAGSYGTGSNPNDTSTYDFLRPHQFINFDECRFGIGSNPYAPARLRTGQNAQQIFRDCGLDGDGTKPLIVDSPEVIEPDGTIRGGWNRPVPTFIAISTGGGFNEDKNCWPQGGSLGAMIAKVNNYKLRAYFENNLVGGMALQNCSVDLDLCQFANSGSAPGQAVLDLSGGVQLTGRNNTGGTNGFQIRSVGDNYVARGLFNEFGKTSGLTPQLPPIGDGGLVTGNRTDVFVNTSLAPINTILSNLAWGEELTIRAHNGPLIFVTTDVGNLDVPGGRIVLRSGDTITFRREDAFRSLWAVRWTIAELINTAMPTTGYFEAGEFVRNVSPPGVGPYVLGWSRLNTNSNHVAGADWRVIKVTGE